MICVPDGEEPTVIRKIDHPSIQAFVDVSNGILCTSKAPSSVRIHSDRIQQSKCHRKMGVKLDPLNEAFNSSTLCRSLVGKSIIRELKVEA